MYIIVGLGNPGKQYENTRHNVGFNVIDILAKEYDISVTKIKHKALIGEGRIGSEKVLLVKPQTYMNLSGDSVREFVNFYKLSPEEIIVVCDDINLPVGGIRIRKKGSDGGQKGLRSIIGQLGYDNFTRVRVGVGEKPAGWDLAKHVLSKFTDDEKDDIISGITDAAEAVSIIVKTGDVDKAMNKFNKKGQGKQ